MCDPHTRKPRGFGFVTYDSTAAVDRACVNKFHELNGKRGVIAGPRRAGKLRYPVRVIDLVAKPAMLLRPCCLRIG